MDVRPGCHRQGRYRNCTSTRPCVVDLNIDRHPDRLPKRFVPAALNGVVRYRFRPTGNRRRPRPPAGLDYLKVFWPKISTFRNWLLVEAAEDTKRIEQP